MKIIFSDSKPYEKKFFANMDSDFEVEHLPIPIDSGNARFLPEAEILCSFVSDKLDRECLEILASKGLKMIALRCAGFNHVDIASAAKLGIVVARVPEYSPYAIAEFAVALLLNINRKVHKSYARVREMNFSLDGLVGHDIHGKTVGVIGAGRIGKIFANIMSAMGARVFIHDLVLSAADIAQIPNAQACELKDLFKQSDFISLHVPLNKDTRHIIDETALSLMKKNVFIINTGRGALIDTKALINALKKNTIGGAALDVYEEEENIFFHDLSATGIQDDVLARLLTFPNVLITSHQAFLTEEALMNIAQTTEKNITDFIQRGSVDGNNRV